MSRPRMHCWIDQNTGSQASTWDGTGYTNALDLYSLSLVADPTETTAPSGLPFTGVMYVVFVLVNAAPGATYTFDVEIYDPNIDTIGADEPTYGAKRYTMTVPASARADKGYHKIFMDDPILFYESGLKVRLANLTTTDAGHTANFDFYLMDMVQQHLTTDFHANTNINPFSRHGVCQSGSTSTTIKLDASASATDDVYRGRKVQIEQGTGIGQERTITAYNGTTKVATVTPAWNTTPTTSSVFRISYENSELYSKIDGVERNIIEKMLMAVMAGKVTYTDNGNGTSTAVFRDQADAANVLSVTYNNTTSSRTGTATPA